MQPAYVLPFFLCAGAWHTESLLDHALLARCRACSVGLLAVCLAGLHCRWIAVLLAVCWLAGLLAVWLADWLAGLLTV